MIMLARSLSRGRGAEAGHRGMITQRRSAEVLTPCALECDVLPLSLGVSRVRTSHLTPPAIAGFE
jgi:hypothetical protein